MEQGYPNRHDEIRSKQDTINITSSKTVSMQKAV